MGSIGRGEAWTPVIWRPRFEEAPVDFWRLRSALKDEARGAAMTPLFAWCVEMRVGEEEGQGRGLVDGVDEVVVDVVLGVHRPDG